MLGQRVCHCTAAFLEHTHLSLLSKITNTVFFVDFKVPDKSLSYKVSRGEVPPTSPFTLLSFPALVTRITPEWPQAL